VPDCCAGRRPSCAAGAGSGGAVTQGVLRLLMPSPIDDDRSVYVRRAAAVLHSVVLDWLHVHSLLSDSH